MPAARTIFTFGSNRQGIHGAGAALTAARSYGAIRGRGEGLQGNSYAIPTKETPYKSLALCDVGAHVATFLRFAEHHPEMRFYVTRIGCGLAGFTEAQIAPMFKDAPTNCDLPEGWRSTAAP